MCYPLYPIGYMGHVYQGVCKVYLDGINLKVFNKLSLIIINYFSKTSKVSKAAQRKRFVIEPSE